MKLSNYNLHYEGAQLDYDLVESYIDKARSFSRSEARRMKRMLRNYA